MQDIINLIQESIQNKTLIKITLSKKINKSQDLKNLFIKPMTIKGETKFNLVFKYQTKDITKNVDEQEMLENILKLVGVGKYLKIADIFTTKEHTTVIVPKSGELKIITKKLEQDNILSESQTNISDQFTHNRIKTRALKIDNPVTRIYLEQLGLVDQKGSIIPSMSSKFKQINQYIELLKPHLQSLQANSNIYDIGSGKGYLTFALADYLNSQQINIVGVESRTDLVNQTNQIASLAGLSNLKFETGFVADYLNQALPIEAIIALHACDTATDEAILLGLKNNSQLIVVSPCCQRQVRSELEQTKKESDNNGLNQMYKHGILLERIAADLTDTIRALLLEIAGYKVKVIEFTSIDNTPKNILIIAEKVKGKTGIKKLKADLVKLKSTFGLENHFLESQMIKHGFLEV